MSKKKLLFITDPYESLAPYREDTSLRMIEAALDLGHDCNLTSYLSLSQDMTTLSCLAYQCVPDHANRIEITEPKTLNLKSFDEIHYRIDPPVDAHYLAPLHMMKGLPVINPIEALCTLNEKTIPLLIPGAAPEMCVSTDWEQLYGFGKSHQRTVLKPLNGFQSRNVELLYWQDEVAQKMSQMKIQELSKDFTVPVVLQEYLEEIHQGEIRVWYINSKPIGVVRRHPPQGDFRVGSVAKLSAEKISMIPGNIHVEVQKFLTQHKIRFAAVDFIRDRISDFNITSPGLIVEMEDVLKKELAKLCFSS